MVFAMGCFGVGLEPTVEVAVAAMGLTVVEGCFLVVVVATGLEVVVAMGLMVVEGCFLVAAIRADEELPGAIGWVAGGELLESIGVAEDGFQDGPMGCFLGVPGQVEEEALRDVVAGSRMGIQIWRQCMGCMARKCMECKCMGNHCHRLDLE